MSVRSFFSLGKRTNERSILTTDCPQSIDVGCVVTTSLIKTITLTYSIIDIYIIISINNTLMSVRSFFSLGKRTNERYDSLLIISYTVDVLLYPNSSAICCRVLPSSRMARASSEVSFLVPTPLSAGTIFNTHTYL